MLVIRNGMVTRTRWLQDGENNSDIMEIAEAEAEILGLEEGATAEDVRNEIETRR